MRREVLVVGGGRVGRHTAKNLPAERYRVTIVEQKARKCDTLTEYDVSEVIEGDGSDEETLTEAGYEKADTVAALTNDTETNVEVSEMVEEVNPDAKSIVRISADGEQDLSYRAHIDNIVYPAEAGAKLTSDCIQRE